MRCEIFDTSGRMIAAQSIDVDAGTITIERDGIVVESRPFTADESLRYAPPEPTAEEKLARARTVLEQIGSLPAPVLTADVVDLLDDLGTVL